VITGTTTGWVNANQDLQQGDTTPGPHAVAWIGSEKVLDTTFTTFQAQVKRIGTTPENEVGMIFGVDDVKKIFYGFTASGTQAVLTKWNYSGTMQERYLLGFVTIPLNTWTNMTLTIQTQNLVTLSVGGVTWGPLSKDDTGTFAGAVGFVSYNGPASFRVAELATQTQLSAQLVTCVSTGEFVQRLASILGVTTAQITDVTITTPCVGAKRQAFGTSFSFALIGTDTVSSGALAGQYLSKVANNHVSLDANNLGTASATAAPPATGGFPISALVSLIAVGVGLTAGAIVGIVIAVTVGTAAAAGGGATAYRVKTGHWPLIHLWKPAEPKDDFDKHKENPKETRKKPKGATVDLYNFNPDDITSITARSPPRPYAKKKTNQ